MVILIGSRWHAINAGWRDETDVIAYGTHCGRSRSGLFATIKPGRRATCKVCRKRLDSMDAKRHAGQTRNSATDKAPGAVDIGVGVGPPASGLSPYPGGSPTPGARLTT